MPPALSDDEDMVKLAETSRISPRSSVKVNDGDELAADHRETNGSVIDVDNEFFHDSDEKIDVVYIKEEDEDQDDDNASDNTKDGNLKSNSLKGNEEVYVVEKILTHMILDDDTLRFKVKWEGYPKKSDQTWEPEENLSEDASDILNEYFESIGGRETIFKETALAIQTKKRSRQSIENISAPTKRSRKNGTHPAETSPPASFTKTEFKPPAGSWEDLIDTLDACQDEVTHKLVVYATWNNGYKSRHEAQVIYKRCPQKMLQFYERHVRIINIPDQEVATDDTAQAP